MSREKLPNSPELPQVGGYAAFVPRFYTLWRMLSNKVNELSDSITNIGGGTPADPDTSVQFNDGGVFGGSANLTWTNSTSTLLADGTVQLDASSYLRGKFDASGTQSLIQNAESSFDGTYISVIPRVVGTVPGNKVWITAWSRPTTTDAAYHQMAIRNDFAMHIFGRGSSGSTDIPTALATGYSPDGTNTQFFTVQYNTGNLLLTDFVGNTIPSNPGVRLKVEGAATVDGNLTVSGTGRKFVADTVNATLGARFIVQDSGTNNSTVLSTAPNGSGNASYHACYNASDLTNASGCYVAIESNIARLVSTRNGSGTTYDLSLQVGDTPTEALRVDTSLNVRVGRPSLATNAANGFVYVPICAGTPTGTPTTITGYAPIVVDTTNHKLYFYSGGAWRDAGP
jgi:hypothetical protein